MSIGNNINVGTNQEVLGTTPLDSATTSKKLSITELLLVASTERSDILNQQLRNEISAISDGNKKISMLGDIQAKLRDMKLSTNAVNDSTWVVDQNASPKEIQLDNGYKIQIHGERESFTILDAEGHETKIWGDPHVNEGDVEGETNWDFKEDSTFILGDGTKIHVKTVPSHRDDGTTFSDSITITKGNQSLEVTGIAANEPVIGLPGLEGEKIDAEIPDGHVFKMGDDADDWLYEENGSSRELGTGELISGDVENLQTGGETLLKDESNLTQQLTPEEIALLEEIGVDPTGFIGGAIPTPNEIDNLIKKIKSSQDSLTSTTQLQLIKLQSLNGKFEQTNATTSQFMKSSYGQIKEIIRNI